MNAAIDWFARNSVAANLLMAFLVCGGVLAALSVTADVFPEVTLDRVRIAEDGGRPHPRRPVGDSGDLARGDHERAPL